MRTTRKGLQCPTVELGLDIPNLGVVTSPVVTWVSHPSSVTGGYDTCVFVPPGSHPGAEGEVCPPAAEGASGGRSGEGPTPLQAHVLRD